MAVRARYEKLMKKDKLRVGIVGYGVVGKRRRLMIDLHPSLKTVAVCDQAFSEVCVLDDGVKAFQDYKQLFNESLDVIFISVPNYLAAEVTMAGLERGVHVFCEKPPGRSVSDIEKVIKVEKKHPDLVLKYGFNHRYHESVREAFCIIKSGVLGEIINLRGVYGKSKIISYTSGWRAERKFAGGGILLDQGIHMLDLMTLFCGEFTEIKSFVSNKFWNHDVEDNAYAIMKDRHGRIATLHSSATQWQHRFSLDIGLTEGYLLLQGILSGSKSYGSERLVIGNRNDCDTGTAREETVTYLEDNSWRDEVHEFADAIVNGNRIQSGTSSDALASMKLVFKIYYGDPQWRDMFQIPNPDGKYISIDEG